MTKLKSSKGEISETKLFLQRDGLGPKVQSPKAGAMLLKYGMTDEKHYMDLGLKNHA
jgi:hypothetical protein